MSDALISAPEGYGATRGQLVGLARLGAGSLRYVDLVRSPPAERPAVVLESQGQPRAYVFDAMGTEPGAARLVQWVRRIALRGEADFVAVLRPGRLDACPALLDGTEAPRPVPDLPEGLPRFPTLLHAPPRGGGGAVRKALRDLLLGSIGQAKRLGAKVELDGHDALSLVGRALFWRFLIDRGLLRGLSAGDICGDSSVERFESCMDGKARALATFDWLDHTFNGGLLTFHTPVVSRMLAERARRSHRRLRLRHLRARRRRAAEHRRHA